MAKYIFQNGGPSQDTFDYTNSDFFNSLADQIQAPSFQQNEEDVPQEQTQPEEENDYIKNLRAYDDTQPNDEITSRLDQLEQSVNSRLDQINQQQEQQGWLSSQDGIDYINDLYDTRTPSSPLADGGLEQAQLSAESGGNDNALSPKGARGAYQFMPQTWEQYKPYAGASPNNRADAKYAYNKYMGVLLNQFGNDQRKAVAAYNAGPTRVSNLIKTYGSEWEQHLPDETKGYLNKIFNIKTNHNANINQVNQKLLSVVGDVNSQYPGLVITSGTDGQHTNNSAHYDGDAVDIGANSSNRTAYNNFKQLLPQLQQRYGVKFLDEGDHIHLSLSNKGKL